MNDIRLGGYTSIEQAAESLPNSKNRERTSDVSFQDIFQLTKESIKTADRTESSDGVRFSKHADARLKQREIQLTDEQMTRLNEGTQKAGSKGIRESLVILDNLAFIVNTENRTVVTAMDSNLSDENIYTNIDGAVII